MCLDDLLECTYNFMYVGLGFLCVEGRYVGV